MRITNKHLQWYRQQALPSWATQIERPEREISVHELIPETDPEHPAKQSARSKHVHQADNLIRFCGHHVSGETELDTLLRFAGVHADPRREQHPRRAAWARKWARRLLEARAAAYGGRLVEEVAPVGQWAPPIIEVETEHTTHYFAPGRR